MKFFKNFLIGAGAAIFVITALLSAFVVVGKLLEYFFGPIGVGVGFMLILSATMGVLYANDVKNGVV